METTVRTSRPKPLLLFLLVYGAAALWLTTTTIDRIANQEHANTKHIHAPLIRNHHERGLCYEKQAYISVQRGTLLVLCKIDDKPTTQAAWGGLIWRVLEHRHGSTALLAPDELYECTVFASGWTYWYRVIARDGYVKAMDTEWYKPLRWLISP